MENIQHILPPENKDPVLWELAKRRASFKYHLAAYLTVNAFFWVLWYFTGTSGYNNRYPWPVWPALGWGIGLLFHFFGAYVAHRDRSVEREYEKLIRKKNNH